MKVRLPLALVLAALLPAAGARAGDGEPSSAPPAPAPAPAPAPGEDVLVLKSGGEIRGRITAEDDGAFAVKVGGALRVVDRADVREVRRGPPVPETPEAENGEMEESGKPGKKRPKGEDRPEDPKARRKEMKKEDGAMKEGDADRPPPLSKEAGKWARTCIERLLASSDPAVRRSAAEALRAMGPGVRPILDEAIAAASGDEDARGVLLRVAASLDAPRTLPGDAPPPGRRPEGPRGPMDRIRTELGLDEAGTRAVGEKLLAYGREVRDLLEDARDGIITPDDARTKAADLRNRLRESLGDVLNEEQGKKLDSILDGMTPGRKP